MTTVRSAQFEGVFKSWNLAYELIDEVNIDTIQRDPAAQVRQLANRAIPENVEQYALQMRNGAEFPPVVVWAEHNILLDGNTRLSAAKKIGRAAFPVYRVQVPFLDMAKALTATLQELSGQRLTASERRDAALAMIDLNFTDANIAMCLGVTAEAARQWRRLQQVAEQAERTGTIAQLKHINKTNQLALGKIAHDQPFRELVMAIDAGKPDMKAVRETVEKVAAATSDEAALAIVAEARSEWAPIGPEPKSTRVNRKAQQARMHIGGLLGLQPVEMVDRAKAAEDLAKWRSIAALAEQVIGLLSAEATA